MTSFGHALRDDFPLTGDGVYLNHGTVGVTPLAVMRARTAILDEIERHPARFMLRELTHLDATSAATASGSGLRLRAAAERVAAFLGCAGDGLVFVDNATSGICAVLRSMPLDAGDEILLPDHVYGGVAHAAAFIARERGASIATFALPFPDATPESMVDAVTAAINPRTRVALLDHVTADTALVMPLAAMAAACRARGVAVLVDGAHAPGALPVAIEALGVDWYVANLHKWAFVPRACGVLWAAPQRRHGLHPAVLSWGVANDDWLAEFDWTGTRDPSPWLAAPAGIDYMEERLGVDAMRTYNHALAWHAVSSLDARWGGPRAAPETMIGCMAVVALPPSAHAGIGPADAATAQRVRDALLFTHGIEIPVLARAGTLWMRVSAQVYNDGSDIERLGAAVEALGR